MTDEIAGGGNRLPRWYPRAALVLAAVVLFGYVLSHRQPAVRPQAEPAVEVPARQVISPGPRADLSGSVRAGPPGLRLLVDGTDPRIVDAHTLAVTPVPGLRLRPGQAARVLQFGPAGLAALAALDGLSGGIYLVRPGEPALSLGSQDMLVPGREATVVAATYRAGATRMNGLGFDRRVRWQWSLPGKVDPLRDTPAGLVVVQYLDAVGGDAVLLLLDRQTGGVRRPLGHASYAVATDDRSIAWVPARCDSDCLLMVTDLSTGAARRYRMPDRREPAAGAFAPDGQHLALSFSGVPADPRTPARPGFAGILDLRTSALTSVPGLATPPSDHADVTWSADGRWLVLGVKWPE
ncbi:MAG TPA: hypothetical protein VEL73_00330, partial [Mycobacteriales bacterium]|nr:hypothetical protein [Mycobacteriales bacterium]